MLASLAHDAFTVLFYAGLIVAGWVLLIVCLILAAYTFASTLRSVERFRDHDRARHVAECRAREAAQLRALRVRYERGPVARALGEGDLQWAELEALWSLAARGGGDTR